MFARAKHLTNSELVTLKLLQSLSIQYIVTPDSR